MANIPIFIPHVGCKNECVFCNQRSITGHSDLPDFSKADEIIKEHLKTLTEKPKIAFFGGSFTGIDRDLMEGYLKIAYEYVKSSQAEGIRLSTRPDYIDEEILEILKKYKVTNIELGAQSLDDEVLSMANRGHDAQCVKKASEMIVAHGFTLGLQMMVGLPKDSYKKSVETAKKIVSFGAKEARIYPTVIIKDTALDKMREEGSFIPMSFDEAVNISADCYSIFFDNKVKVLRIGLPASEELKNSVTGGFYHEAIGEMVYSRVVRNSTMRQEGQVEIAYNSRFQSKVSGQRKENLKYFDQMGKNVVFKVDNSLSGVCVNGKYVLTF